MVKWINSLVSLSAVLAGLLILIVCGVTFFEVVSRYVFNTPTTWSIDISVYGVFWATFLGGAYTLREGGHVAVDVVVRKLGGGFRNSIAVLVFFCVAAFCTIVAWRGWVACIDAYEFGEVTMSVLRFPLYVPMAAVPVGGTLMALQALLMAAARLPNQEPER